MYIGTYIRIENSNKEKRSQRMMSTSPRSLTYTFVCTYVHSYIYYPSNFVSYVRTYVPGYWGAVTCKVGLIPRPSLQANVRCELFVMFARHSHSSGPGHHQRWSRQPDSTSYNKHTYVRTYGNTCACAFLACTLTLWQWGSSPGDPFPPLPSWQFHDGSCAGEPVCPAAGSTVSVWSV